MAINPIESAYKPEYSPVEYANLDPPVVMSVSMVRVVYSVIMYFVNIVFKVLFAFIMPNSNLKYHVKVYMTRKIIKDLFSIFWLGWKLGIMEMYKSFKE